MSGSWDDYLSGSGTDSEGGAVGEVGGVDPVLDAAGVASDVGATAVDWGNWNAATTEEYSADAQGEMAYASEAYASGWDDVGDAAMSRAGASLDTAAGHAETADSFYATADSNFDASAEDLTVAGDSSSYDTSSYDAGSDDSV